MLLNSSVVRPDFSLWYYGHIFLTSDNLYEVFPLKSPQLLLKLAPKISFDLPYITIPIFCLEINITT